MLTLLLLRHAKSSWPGDDTADIDRPLNARGKRAAEAIGRHLAASGPMPQRVLCSPARRTRNTWDVLSAGLKAEPDFIVDDALYDFGDGNRLLECLARRGGEASVLMLIGHNPAIGELANWLTGHGDKTLRGRMAKKYPTGALAVIGLPAGNWRALRQGSGELLAFTRPKELLGDTGE